MYSSCVNNVTKRIHKKFCNNCLQNNVFIKFYIKHYMHNDALYSKCLLVLAV